MATMKRSAYAAMYRPDHRRPPAPGRYRPHTSKSSATLTTYGEEVQIRRRQGPPRRHGPSLRNRAATEGALDLPSSPTPSSIDRYRHLSKPTCGAQGTGASPGIGKAGNPAHPCPKRRRERHRPRDYRGDRGRGPDPDRRRAWTVHVHFICPQQVDDASCVSGITTMLGGGTGPAHRHATPPPARRAPLAHRDRMLPCRRRPSPSTSALPRQGQ